MINKYEKQNSYIIIVVQILYINRTIYQNIYKLQTYLPLSLESVSHSCKQCLKIFLYSESWACIAVTLEGKKHSLGRREEITSKELGFLLLEEHRLLFYLWILCTFSKATYVMRHAPVTYMWISCSPQLLEGGNDLLKRVGVLTCEVLLYKAQLTFSGFKYLWVSATSPETSEGLSFDELLAMNKRSMMLS